MKRGIIGYDGICTSIFEEPWATRRKGKMPCNLEECRRGFLYLAILEKLSSQSWKKKLEFLSSEICKSCIRKVAGSICHSHLWRGVGTYQIMLWVWAPASAETVLGPTLVLVLSEKPVLVTEMLADGMTTGNKWKVTSRVGITRPNDTAQSQCEGHIQVSVMLRGIC